MKIRTVWQENCILGESPVWHPREKILYWTDILKPKLHCYDPKNNTHQDWRMPTNIASIAPNKKGGLIAAFKHGVAILNPITTNIRYCDTMSDVSAQKNVFNDGHCDHQGRFWIGSKNITENTPTGELFCFGADKKLKKMENQIIVSNGVIASPDSKYFYLTDSPTRIIYRYEFDSQSGVIHDRVPFITIDNHAGVPDGMTFDAKGYIWVCHFGGARITRFTPDGKIDRVIKMPVTYPTSCCFGDSHLKTLYVTSARRDLSDEQLKQEPQAGYLFAMDVDVPGITEGEYHETV